MKKYTKIKNRGIKLENYYDRGLYIQEKLDGSNASFTINDGKIECFSRRIKLNDENTLNGFLGWVHDYFLDLFDYGKRMQIDYLSRYIFFGEWLVKHKINYKEDQYKSFYLFDVYDKVSETYLGLEEVESLADIFTIKMAEVFYIAKPEKVKDLNLEDLKGYVGKSNKTAIPNTGEGIVIKYLDGKSIDENYYKYVTKEFSEIKRYKLNDKTKKEGIVDYAITKPRMEKMIFRALEENRLKKDDLVIENFKKIISEIGEDFVQDILIEEHDGIIEKASKEIKRKMPHVLREILMNDKAFE